MRIIGTVFFRVWHSSVFVLPHCIYGEFFGLFESFSPFQMKTPKQLKYDALHYRFQKPPSRPFKRKRYAGVFKNSTLGTVFKARKYRLRVDGKLNGEKKSVPFQKIPGYVWTTPNLSLWRLRSVSYQLLWPDLLLYLNVKLTLFLVSFVLHCLKLSANNSLVS